MEQELLNDIGADLNYGEPDTSILKPKQKRTYNLTPEARAKKAEQMKLNVAKHSLKAAEKKAAELAIKQEQLKEKLSKGGRKAKEIEPEPEPVPVPAPAVAASAPPAPPKKKPARKTRTRTVIIQESSDSEDYADHTESESESEDEVIYVSSRSRAKAPPKPKPKKEEPMLKRKREPRPTAMPAEEVLPPPVLFKFL